MGYVYNSFATSVYQAEAIVNVTHNYQYYGKAFTVTYVFDNESQEILDAYGDLETAEEIFAKEQSPEGTLVTSKEEETESITINMMLFDTANEIDAYLENTTENAASQLSKNCINGNQPGVNNVYFFEDIDYNREFTGIRGINKRLHGRQWLGTENDKISSFYIQSSERVQISFYEHSCYTGKRLTFDKGFSQFYGVNNFTHYTLSGTWFWRVSWNDQASCFWMIER